MARRPNRRPLTDTERDARRKADRKRIEQAVKHAHAAYDKAEAHVREQQRAERQPAEPDTDDGIGDELDENLDNAA